MSFGSRLCRRVGPVAAAYLTMVAVGSLAGLEQRADASVVLAVDIETMTRQADAIAVVDVVSIKSEWESPGAHRIVTIVELDIRERWKGPDAMTVGHRLRIVQPGGTMGNLQMRVQGMPHFTVGTRNVAFLRAHVPGKFLGDDARFAVVGMAQGLRRAAFDSAKSVWMVSPADNDAVFRRRPDGQLMPAPAGSPQPLDELRERVRLAQHDGTQP